MRPAEFTCERRRDVTTDIYVAPYFSRFLRGVPGYISRRRRYVSGASQQMDSHFSPLSIWMSLGKLGFDPKRRTVAAKESRNSRYLCLGFRDQESFQRVKR